MFLREKIYLVVVYFLSLFSKNQFWKLCIYNFDCYVILYNYKFELIFINVNNSNYIINRF